MTTLGLSQLKLWNYRCFKQVFLRFHPQMTVLVAANGAGKTSVLDAIAVALGPYVGAFDEGSGPHFGSGDIRLFRVRDTASNEMEYAAEGVRLDAYGSIPGSLEDGLDETLKTHWFRSLAGPVKAKTTIKDAKQLADYGKRMQAAVRTPGELVCLPLLAYYGTGRLWQQKRLTEAKKKIQRTSRTIAYTDCLDPASSYKSFVEWFRYWSFNAKDLLFKGLSQSEAYREYADCLASVTRAVDICLAPAGWSGLEYDFRLDALVVRHQAYGALMVDQLSDGIRNMIGLVADIAFRATKLNAYLGARASQETPGIVLIDEVDMHLHPEWQQVVLQQLQEAFPKVQFVVTTHSPQVLTSVDKSCIRVLRQRVDPDTGETTCLVEEVDMQTRGVSSADLLARIMGVDPVPDVSEARRLSEYHALIQQNLHESSEGKILRGQLDEHFGADHPLMQDCDRMIRLQAFKQRLPRQLGRGEG
jgi:predicted ATP-binding protein involved in virulence